MWVTVSDNIPAVERYLSEVQRKVIPLARAKALTFTAEAVRDAEKAEMAAVFDRPTRYTMNALALRPATALDPRAEVFFKEFAGKGTPASNYLTPHVKGGGRGQKRSERALSTFMGNKGYWVPGAGAKLDGSGNISGATITRILSQVRAGDPFQYMGKRGASRSGSNRYFIPRPGSSLAPGVYQRVGKHIRPILIFVASVSYRKRFDFHGIAERIARRVFPDKWAKSLARELDRLNKPR